MFRISLLFFSASFILTIAIGIFSIWKVRNMIETEKTINSTNEISYELEQLISNSKDLYISLRTFIITGDTADLKEREVIRQLINKNIIKLQSMMTDSVAISDLQNLSTSINQRTEKFGEVAITTRKKYGFEAAKKFFTENKDQVLISEVMPALILKIRKREQETLNRRVATSNRNANRTISFVLAGSVLSIIIVIIALVIFREDRREISQNLVEIKESRAELAELASQLQIRNSALLNFSHVTSHNLRSPVGNLKALLRFYRDSSEAEDREMLIGKFETVIQHLSATLNELVETLKVEKEVSDEFRDVSFEAVFRKTEDILSGDLIETSAVVTHDFTMAKSIDYRNTYLESIMLNLFSNAIKYRSPERTLKINFKTEIHNGEVTLLVTDNGLGIDLKKYGDKLFGLNNTFHQHTEAKGVGLYITKIQIESLGGSISVASKINVGTTFIVVFGKTLK